MSALSTRLAAFLLFLVSTSIVLSAQLSVNYPSFSTATTGMVLNGSTTLTASALELTSAVNTLVGSAWYQSPLLVAAGFDTTFSFQITGTTVGTPGADGMAFVIQNAVAGSTALGTNGNELGYGGTTNGIENSLVIELDVYSNTNVGDPVAGNQISVHTNGTGINGANEVYSIGAIAASATLGNAQVHTMRINYVPGTLRIYLNNLTTPLLTVPYNFTTGGTFTSGSPVGGLSLANYSAYVGFTGATGGIAEAHDVLSWIWTSTNLADPCFDGTVGLGAGGPYDVLTVNGSTGGFQRTINVPVTQPITVQMALPPGQVTPSPFIIWGFVGAAGIADQYPTNFGTLCIYPHLINPFAPWLFTLADSVGTGPTPILPSVPAPWGWVIPNGLSTPSTFTIQGLMMQPNGGGQFIPATTNGMIVNVNAAPAPTITSILPNSAVAGAPITITGTNFLQGAIVNIGFNYTPTSVTPTQIIFPMPSGIACGSILNVLNPDGQSISRVFNPQPTITSTPTSQGPQAGGQNYIIIGSGFAPGTTVTIGGNPVNITTTSATVLVGTTPPGTQGQKTVVVTTPGGCVVTTNYTYL